MQPSTTCIARLGIIALDQSEKCGFLSYHTKYCFCKDQSMMLLLFWSWSQHNMMFGKEWQHSKQGVHPLQIQTYWAAWKIILTWVTPHNCSQLGQHILWGFYICSCKILLPLHLRLLSDLWPVCFVPIQGRNRYSCFVFRLCSQGNCL